MSHRIRYYSLLDGCGYGDAATDYMAELVARGHEVSWSPLAWTQRGLAPWRLLPPSMRPDLLNPAADPAHRRQRFRELVERPLEADTVIMHCMPELWPKLREPGKVNIGYEDEVLVVVVGFLAQSNQVLCRGNLVWIVRLSRTAAVLGIGRKARKAHAKHDEKRDH